MTDYINKMALDLFGIKTDPDNAEKLRAYLLKTYGNESLQTVKKVFASGEAADILTVNETYFFREPSHFQFLLETLPAFENSGIQICSAAASKGCEAYSIAMMIETYNKRAENPISYSIDAFDVSSSVIEAACKGVYNTRVFREDGSGFRYMADPYIEKLSDGYRVNTSLKKNINFFVHNLMDELPSKEYDFIFFRNAFIYFTPENRERVVSNLSAVLKERGIIFFGVSETIGVRHESLDGKNKGDLFYFQKSAGKN